jgi:hypothetical protein
MLSDGNEVRLLPGDAWIECQSLLADAFLFRKLRCSLSASPRSRNS